ncbi:MAG: Lrp/AsnC family transcriptional regulator [Candidatus Pacearchaeota archaeon]
MLNRIGINNLKLLDRKILSLLEYNPRISLKELSKECRVSKDTIKYRIKKLEEEKIILGYTIYIDYKRLGNFSYKLFLKINSPSEKKEELKEFLRKQKNVFDIFDSTGRWNLAIAFFTPDIKEFNSFENSLLDLYGSFVSTRRFCSMIDAEIYKRDFFQVLNDKRKEVFFLWKELNNREIDEHDKKIIRILHSNSRSSLVSISEKVGLSIDSTKKRILKLKKEGIIPLFKTKINYEKLGFDQYKLLIFPKRYSNQTEEGLINFFRKNKRCINIIRTVGPWKLEAELLVQDSSEVEEILNNLNEEFGEYILDIEASIIRNEEIFSL